MKAWSRLLIAAMFLSFIGYKAISLVSAATPECAHEQSCESKEEIKDEIKNEGIIPSRKYLSHFISVYILPIDGELALNGRAHFPEIKPPSCA